MATTATITLNPGDSVTLNIGAFTVRGDIEESQVQWYCTLTNSGRFLKMVDGGGHLELVGPGSITTDTGLELDAGGHAVFHLE